MSNFLNVEVYNAYSKQCSEIESEAMSRDYACNKVPTTFMGKEVCIDNTS